MPDVNSTSQLPLNPNRPVPNEPRGPTSDYTRLKKDDWEHLQPRRLFLPSARETPAPTRNTQIQFKGVSVRSSVRAGIEEGLRELRTLTEITAAAVQVERRAELSPAMQVQVRLAVSGPDFHATVTDHTVPAALIKAFRNLRRQIQRRNAKRRRRNTGEQLVHRPENRRNGSPCR